MTFLSLTLSPDRESSQRLHFEESRLEEYGDAPVRRRRRRARSVERLADHIPNERSNGGPHTDIRPQHRTLEHAKEVKRRRIMRRRRRSRRLGDGQGNDEQISFVNINEV